MPADFVLPAPSEPSGQSRPPGSASAYHQVALESDEARHFGAPSPTHPAPSLRRHDADEQPLLAWDIQQGGGGQSVEWFFDRVNHDILIDRLRRRIDDAGVIWLVRAYLTSGIMGDGVVVERYQGTPQGGPLSPLLANVLLDEVDQVLERHGHCFARYADDCNVYVRSRKAGERVMALLRKCYDRLHLAVNEAKSAVADVRERKFLGFSFWYAQGGVKRGVAASSLAAFKHRIRQLTRRSGGRSVDEVIQRLRPYLLGWNAYYRLAQTPGVRRRLDEWLRHRLRAIHLKHWRRGTTIYRACRQLGASPWLAQQAAAGARHWWRGSAQALNAILSVSYFDRLGLPRLS